MDEHPPEPKHAQQVETQAKTDQMDASVQEMRAMREKIGMGKKSRGTGGSHAEAHADDDERHEYDIHDGRNGYGRNGYDDGKDDERHDDATGDEGKITVVSTVPNIT